MFCVTDVRTSQTTLTTSSSVLRLLLKHYGIIFGSEYQQELPLEKEIQGIS
jgi:hypothetical protein